VSGVATSTGTGRSTPGGVEVTLVARGRASATERLAVLAFSAGAMVLLGLARSIRPDGRGFGTHEQLGLPPCGLMQLAHIPCPSCGMTTAFAHAVRLEVVEAARAQPFGLLLAALAAVAAALGPVAAVAGVRVTGVLSPAGARRLALGFLGGILAAWAYKIAVVLWMVPA
jgi:hypothetical protein